ncbi:hypothetical protein [Paenibacillus donghaensis]|uniref:Bulb-type lectin domain-containing protein n=1 Tax=Paenibacillus donghaensis TaxID=414771 RepID=A0A2Z2KEU8_9BACL|nr:hypothetical protein [Paenibacillus donghaensis]ASA21633.1 hypothetical protein B9T62_13145 [Paenibacillus donghaensis]
MDNLKICTQVFESLPNDLHNNGVDIVREAAVIKSRRWLNGSTISVYFMDGDPLVHEKVRKYALEWTEYANIIFDFVSDPTNSEIRISFEGTSSNSKVGTDCLSVAKDKPTMHFGWLEPDSSDDEFSRVVLHEFGHALGLIHEHQSPEGNVPWDEPAVYRYYLENDGWDRDTTFMNVLKRYSHSETNYTEFDKNSIMIYKIPDSHTRGDYKVDWNSKLSQKDKEFIGKIYPKVIFNVIGDRIHPTEKLRPGDILQSENTKFSLVLQGDGNLVLYPTGSINALWSSRTYGKNVDWAVLQEDGNFVIYGEHSALWATNTFGNTAAWLVVQDDGNVVIYAPNGGVLWATNTMQH